MTWLLVTRSPVAQLTLLSLIPGIHIAQIPFQVIGNCGVISLMQRSNSMVRSARPAKPDFSTGTTAAIPGWRGAQYDGIVAFAACEYFERGPGVGLMTVAILVAGIGCLLAGLLTIGFGIPVKEFSFGNTLILSGAVAACTGLVILGLWAVVRELKTIAVRLDAGMPSDREGTELKPTAATPPPRRPTPEGGGYLFTRDQPAAEGTDGAESDAPPWRDEAVARGIRGDVPPEAVETAPAAKPKRNLMFSSTSRRERERAQARATDVSANELGPAPVVPPPVPEPNEPPPATFNDAWPRSERARSTEAPGQRRSGRAPSTFSEATPDAAGADRHPPAVRNEDQPPVTVLKSGVVDGMAYSLYSDGSIEAQMPEGMMRFASIDELRSHLDQRP